LVGGRIVSSSNLRENLPSYWTRASAVIRPFVLHLELGDVKAENMKGEGRENLI
jgi:hypothetical protein